MGFIGSIYLYNLSRDFPFISDTIAKWTSGMEYGEKAVSDLMPGVAAVTDGTDKCPSLQVKGEWVLQQPPLRRKNNCFVVKIQNTSFPEREEHLPAAGTACALNRW